MVAQCSICLSNYRDPVCLPCGHLYCKKCLTDHVNVPTNREMTSTCPDCRATFNIAIPDLTYLPQKYHQFISHAVRRVFVDFAPDAALQKKLKQTEKTLLMKTRGEEALMKRCESLTAALDAHRTGEREATERIEELEEQLMDLDGESSDKITELNKRCYELEAENSRTQKTNKVLQGQLEALRKSLEASEARQRTLERNMFVRHLDSDQSRETAPRLMQGFIGDESIPVERVVRPLPRRRIMRRSRDDDISSPSIAPPKRPRFSTERPRLIWD
ncbi:hypothetical protein GALMADRAFT_241306 [Galerina marginata CBS 339.88]|uniref:RING-type domain-containing protein n=1 Tax=Galerina marginata (strain CBS 339.88) TaxID=685588 RepID=A0A067TCF5_GALM3|nr:hypothetical protein GALMADRAFT_241306 [Galerina marginata CBS 339.88]